MSIQCKIHGVIHYLVWMGKTPVEAYNEVKTAYGDKAMNCMSVFNWCSKFKNGHTSVHNDQRSGISLIGTDDEDQSSPQVGLLSPDEVARIG